MTAVAEAARCIGYSLAGPSAGYMALPEAAERIRAAEGQTADILVVGTLASGWEDTVDLSAGWADSDPCCVAFPECGVNAAHAMCARHGDSIAHLRRTRRRY